MFQWLSRKGERLVAARFPLAFLSEPGGGAVPSSYEARARAAFLDNPVASRAIRLVAEALGAAPLKIAGGDAVDALIERPSPRASGRAFREEIAAHLVMHGNAYVDMVPGADGRPAELHALRPERVRIATDANGWPAAYLYRVEGREARLPGPSEAGPGVLHIRSLSPLGDLYGEGALGAAAGAVAAHNEAARWNRSLIGNSARPSGALVYESEAGPLAPEQFQRLKEEMEAGFTGAGRAGRPMLLEGGLKWQPLGLSPSDMDYAGGQAAAARDIALALGVPPMLLGLPGDNTYANYAEANRALWRLTVLPMAARVAEALTHWLRHFWAEAGVAVDLDQVPALSADRERLWARVSAADFLSAAEKRALLGLMPAEHADAGEGEA